MGQITPFSIGKRNLDKKNHWEELDINSYKITKPTVICFGGNCTRVPRDANEICKIAQNLVGIKSKSIEKEIATREDVDFIGVCYGENSFNKKTTRLTKEERSLIAQEIFLSLCKDESGNILSDDQIVKNFNLITLFSWCHGSTEIMNIGLNVYKQMKKLGISENTTNMAISQIFEVSYSPNSETFFPALCIISEEDKFRRNGDTNERISTKYLIGLSEKDYKKSFHTAIYKADKNTAVLLTSNILLPKEVNGEQTFQDEHDVFIVDRDDGWRPINSHIDKNGEVVSLEMGNALAKSIANSIQNQYSISFIPKPTIDEHIADARSIIEETQEPAFYSIIKQIKEDCGKSTEDIPEELTT